MPFQEIKTLRKEGKLKEALEKALADIQKSPNDIWVKRSLAWVYFDYLKKYANDCNISDFFKILSTLIELGILNDSSESILRCNVCRTAHALVGKTIDSSHGRIDEVCSRLEQIFQNMAFIPQSEEYDEFLKIFIPAAEHWDGFVTFCERWNFNNLRPDDFKRKSLPNGKKILPFAEQAYLAYAKAIIKKKDTERIQAFCPIMEKQTDNREMTFIGFFHAKLLQSLNTDNTDVLKTVLSFARKKQNEFWIWSFLSELYVNEPEKYLACLLRGISCGKDEKFLLKMRLALAEYYNHNNDLARAKYQYSIYIQTRLSNGWPIPSIVTNVIKNPTYENIEADKTSPIEFIKITNNILGLSNNPVNNTSVQSKNVEGLVTTNKDKTLFFVCWKEQGKKQFALRPKTIVVAENDKIKATIIPQFNKKRNEMGWVCKKVKKID